MLVKSQGPLHAVDAATLLVIGPERFEAAAQPLIAHKNASEMPAHFATLESLTGYYQGVDEPEQIKAGIFYAARNLGTRYVMLLGDGSTFPVRYRSTTVRPGDHNWRDAWYSPADLYYANLYQTHTGVHLDNNGVFADWNADGDFKFNDQHWANDAHSYNPDGVDGCPDVAVGRIPAHTADQVTTYVNKVVAYETGGARPSALRLTLLLDKNYPGSFDLAEGMLTESGVQHHVPAWSSHLIGVNYSASDPLPAPTVDRAAANAIAGAVADSFWLGYIGHGAPSFWACSEIAPDGSSVPIDAAWTATLTNTHSLPIVFVAGCSTGHFVVDTPDDGRYRDVDGETHWFQTSPGDDPAHVWDLGSGQDGGPHVSDWWPSNTSRPMITAPPPDALDFAANVDGSCASGWLFSPGGAIAYFGETTVAPNYMGVNLEGRALKRFSGRSAVLGDVYLYGQQQYLLDFTDDEDVQAAPRIYLCYMTFFGDPSLRLPVA